MNTVRTVRMISVLALCVSPLVGASVLTSWGEADDIVGSTKSIDDAYENTHVVSFASFATTGLTGYYDSRTGKTPDFYGATYRVYDDGTGGGAVETTSNWRIISATPDYLYTSINGGATTAQNDYHTAYIWTQNEFLNGGDTAPAVTLDSMTIRIGDNGSGVSSRCRYIVRLGTDWYVSEQKGEGTQTLADGAAILATAWYDYDPTVDFSDFTGAAATLTATDFDDLTAAGFYHSAVSSGRYVQARLYGMEVTGTVIPEPATFGLLGVGACLCLLRRLHRS